MQVLDCYGSYVMLGGMLWDACSNLIFPRFYDPLGGVTFLRINEALILLSNTCVLVCTKDDPGRDAVLGIVIKPKELRVGNCIEM